MRFSLFLLCDTHWAYHYSINLVINNIPTGYTHNIINLSDSEDDYSAQVDQSFRLC